MEAQEPGWELSTLGSLEEQVLPLKGLSAAAWGPIDTSRARPQLAQGHSTTSRQHSPGASG